MFSFIVLIYVKQLNQTLKLLVSEYPNAA